jgi:IMP dehydrogenase
MDRVKYSFKDIFIIPQYSEVTSRSIVNTNTQIGNLKLDIPIISANMDSISGITMCVAMWNAGGIGALHRFWTDALEYEMAYRSVKSYGADCFISVGVSPASVSLADEFYRQGARYFIIDVAHGHSKQMETTLKAMKKKFPDVFVMAGNVATEQAVADLQDWGADAIKVGIGPGAACLTKNVTGVTYPQFSAIYECAQVANVPLVADGGCTEIGDICKALGAGASLVMLGRMLAACQETPSITFNGRKVYRGMASKDAMRLIRTDALPTPEGTSLFVDELPTTAAEVLQDIKGGIQSACSYSNSTNLSDFSSRVKFGIRK